MHANSNVQVQRNHRLFFSSHLRELAAKYDVDPIGLLGAQTGGAGAYQVLVQKQKTDLPDQP